ncbi:hypothetical protein Pyn_33132 [Prunus yedoensis var. nudiflora]|uniref:Uncharacterized protein n=1 Tax=Prunus yedoensis var. nudiflora TaxID=2094558 RepID=A0A314Z352_PRUYE|nr:hypothetical protein Pyn_33132 [Prunus yedoensis var. nudiflora]
MARYDEGKEMGMHAGLNGVLLKYPLVFWMACVGNCLWPCAGDSQQPAYIGSFGFCWGFCLQPCAGDCRYFLLGCLGFPKVMG